MTLEQDALNRLAGQFQDSPKLRGMVSAIVGPLDDALADIDALKNDRWIDTAQGVQLDGCGAIVGEQRMGRSDDDYRAAIRYRVFVNLSNGTPSDLMQALIYLVGGDDRQYIEAYPAAVMLFSDGPTVPQDIQSQIQDIAPAGISDVPVMVSYTAQPLRFGRETEPSELFVNDQYLTIAGSDLQVNTGQNATANGPRLGGLVPAELTVNGNLLELSNGSFLVVNSANNNIALESGYHLTGVYQ